MAGAPPRYELRNGYWFNGYGFDAGTRYTVYGSVTKRQPVPVDSVIDLQGGYVVPAFGEAHNHNAVSSDTGIAHRYLRAGIYYVKNPNSFSEDRVAAKGKFNTPSSIDVIFSNGGLTGPGGHPYDLVRRNIARGVWKSDAGEGRFHHTIATRADLEAKWPAIIAGEPDFIKTYLLFSDEYAKRLADSTTIGWRGLDPTLLPLIVQRAHDANRRVSTHVETGADFRNALAAGVDEINHLPGFRPEGNALSGYAKLDRYRITADDARDARRRGVVVVTTVSEVLEIADNAITQSTADAGIARRAREMIVGNLRLLRDAGVNVVIGSDRYNTTSAAEAFGLRGTGVYTDTTLLRMWSMATPRAIFPSRKIGALDSGFEASFLVLAGNPFADFENVRRIRMRFKEGVLLALAPPSLAAAQKPASAIAIRIETSLGDIEAELDSARAPITVTNFLRYVDASLFNGGSFFRTVRMDNQPNDSVKIEVIQGGIPREKRATAFAAIPLERTRETGLRHVAGTLSMARGGPDTATDSFFITIGDQPELDFGGKRNKDGQGFAAFGHVTKGLDVVLTIQSQPAQGQTLTAPITILRIVRR
jgi:cyclophilin family peptidyl-prolyl cis-trans isomerase